jgi:hypothetical protein
MATQSWIDLTPHSEANFRRHRTRRLAIAILGCCCFCALAGLGFVAVLTATSPLSLGVRYIFLAIGFLLGYLCLSLAWVPFRYWAPPPVALSVTSQGLDFRLMQGNQVHIPWNRGSLRIELLARAIRENGPVEASHRMWVMWGRGDFELMWRRVVPLTYVPPSVFERVLEEARAQNLSIERIDSRRSIGLDDLGHMPIGLAQFGDGHVPYRIEYCLHPHG